MKTLTGPASGVEPIERDPKGGALWAARRAILYNISQGLFSPGRG
jgi:hypothetical protein